MNLALTEGRSLPPIRTRKSRGSLDRSLNPLGTLVHSVSGRGPNSEWSSCQWPKPLAGCDPKTADGPKTASPRLREDLASRETRRPKDRSTIPKDPRPIFRPSPVPSVSQWLRVPYRGLGVALTTPHLSIRSATGFPLRRDGKRRRAPYGRQLDVLFVFRDLWFGFRERAIEAVCLPSPCRWLLAQRSQTRETPRELWPKPQPSRGSQCHETRKAGPRSGGDPEEPKSLLPRPGRTRAGKRKVRKWSDSVKPYPNLVFAA